VADRLNYPVNLKTCNVHKLLQLCQASNYHLFVITSATEAPVLWSRVPETALPPRQLYRAFVCENVVSVGRVKVLPA